MREGRRDDHPVALVEACVGRRLGRHGDDLLAVARHRHGGSSHMLTSVMVGRRRSNASDPAGSPTAGTTLTTMSSATSVGIVTGIVQA
jgi:hypothetical protein